MLRLLVAFLILPLTASATDAGRFSFLEQEVRNLQRQVQALSRQVDELRTRPDRLEPATGRRGSGSGATSANLPQWADAAVWKRLRAGMSELEVISALGRPTSMRDEGSARVLLYAMEIGPGFLGGSVSVRDHVVVEVRTPTLQ
ncbi:MAG TPA: hypothetical protein VFR18_09145 [Terriglobia bacterium]|nr:hypothetical protein [Terriglobia bacterium]HEU5133612.1 hypothetical protein [Steroidobacteraceae bacterium]